MDEPALLRYLLCDLHSKLALVLAAPKASFGGSGGGGGGAGASSVHPNLARRSPHDAVLALMPVLGSLLGC